METTDMVMAGMRLRVVLHREDDWYVVTCPGLPGCVTQGKTRNSALRNAREAIGLYLEHVAHHIQDYPLTVMEGRKIKEF